MPMAFDRFRYLNQSTVNTTAVDYKLCFDKEGLAVIFKASPVPLPGPLSNNSFVASPSPALPGLIGVRSVSVSVTLQGVPGLVDWVLTSEFEEEDSIQDIALVAELAAAGPNIFRLTARLAFHDGTYEDRVRFLP